MNSKQMNLTGLCALFLMVSGVHAASPVKLTIEDNASLFSETAREEAKAKLLRLSAAADRQVHIETYRELPETQAKLLAEAKGDKAKTDAFWHDWTMAHVKGDRGLVVLINWNPGKVVVKADKAVTAAGFSNTAASDLRERLSKALGEAKKATNDVERKKLLDEALASGVSFIATTLPLERNRGAAGHTSTTGQENARRPAMVAQEGDNGILGYVCLGLVGLMAVWMVVGLMRGGSAGPSMAPAGGGGFFSSLLGGMFGAAAGMWMYNSFFGSNSAFGSSSGWGDSSGGDESGAGDFSGGSESSGDFDTGGGDSGGDYGGGDF
jgi:uncharacterized protein